MRKILLLVVALLCGTSFISGQQAYSQPQGNVDHILYGNPIKFNPIEGAEFYQFIFSLDGDIDTIQTSIPYVIVSEYDGLHLFETYNVVVRYYADGVWQDSEESKRVMFVTDSGTHHMIHDMIKVGNELTSRTYTPTRDNSEIIVPIVYHVIVPTWFDGSPEEYLDPCQIAKSMLILDSVFSGLTHSNVAGAADAADTKIRFRPAMVDAQGHSLSVDYCGHTYYGITYNSLNSTDEISAEVGYPSSYYALPRNYYTLFPPENYVNVWVFEAIDYPDQDITYGLTTSPCLMSGEIPRLGIIKIVTGQSDIFANRSLGYVVAHEMGHYFGLFHTWVEEIGGVVHSSGFNDPPDHDSPSSDCGNDPDVPYNNIMNYSPDGCRYRFSQEQADFMRSKINDMGWFSDPTAVEVHELIPDTWSTRIVAPETNYLCSGNNFDLKIGMSDINYFERLRIEGNGNFEIIIDEYELISENLIAVHVPPLPEGNYEFTIFHGSDVYCEKCYEPISRQYEVIECNNDVDVYNAQWYFDNYVSLDFRSGTAVLGEHSEMNANISESGICNGQGELLFYTDGNKIWNSNHEVVDELNQNIAYRGTIALRFDDTHYAVVSLCDNGFLISRLLEFGQDLNITTFEYNESLLYSSLSAVPCPTGGYWLISTRQGDADLKIVSFKLTLDGTSLVYGNGSEMNLNSRREVDRKAIVIKASPEGKYIACAMAEQSLQIFYFNATHGTFREIDCDIDCHGKSPSLAFSPNGRFLYMSDMLEIKQFDLKNDLACICLGIPSNTVFKRDNDGYYLRCQLSLQEGPDGKIYISKISDFYNFSRTIGAIMEPNNLASTYNGEEDCHIIENIIDYPSWRLLQNRENLPNLVDANKTDTCTALFTICSNSCSIDSLVINNFSLSTSVTWSFYDLSGNLITTSTDFEPVLSNITELHNRNAFIIKQTTACEDHYMLDTVYFGNATLNIEGPEKICQDGRSYDYEISLQPQNQIINIEWSDGYHHNYSDHVFRITPVSPESLIVTCNIIDEFGCPYTASLDVDVASVDYEPTITSGFCNNDILGQAEISINTSESYELYVDDNYIGSGSGSTSFDIEQLYYGEHNFTIVVPEDVCRYEDNFTVQTDVSGFVANVIPKCNEGSVELTSNSGADLSNYTASIIVDGSSYDMQQVGNIFVFGYRSRNSIIATNLHLIERIAYQDIDATITITDNTTGCWTEIDVTIPRAYPSMEILRTIPAQCEGTPCYVEFMVSGGEIYFDEDISYEIGTPELIYTSPNGDLLYRVEVNSSANQVIAYVGNNECPVYKGPLPYEVQEPTFNISHTSICHEGETASVNVQMELFGVEENYPPYLVWNGGENPVPFEQLSGNTYAATIEGVEQGNYTADAHYTSNCAYELEINVELSNVDVSYNYVSENELEVCFDFVSSPYACDVLIIEASGEAPFSGTIYSDTCVIVRNSSYNIYTSNPCGEDDVFPLDNTQLMISASSEPLITCKNIELTLIIHGGTAPYAVSVLGNEYMINSAGEHTIPVTIDDITGEYTIVITVTDILGQVATMEYTISTIWENAVIISDELSSSYTEETLIITPRQLIVTTDVVLDHCTIYCASEDYDNIMQTQWIVPYSNKLTIKSCTIQSGCHDKMWQGITVYGIRFSNPSYIRSLVNVNGSHIQDAVKAVESINNGTIIANGSNFENNQYGIYYNKFITKPYPTNFQQVISLRSRRLTANAIENCNFRTTRNLNDETRYPKAGIYMDNVWGITMKGCKFINEMPWQTVSDPSQKGIGVHSVASSFEADSYNTLISTFSGLHYGVYATGISTNRAIAVLNSNFDGSMFGIYVNENSGAKILNNNIDVMSSSILSSVTNFRTSTQGMYLNTSKSYNVEGNVISGGSTGMYISNSGVDASKIKNNTFSNAVSAVKVIGQNSDYGIDGGNGRRGIQILCNDFISNTNNIGILNGNMRRLQGGEETPTGNQFRLTDRRQTQFIVNCNTAWQMSRQYIYYQHRDRNVTNGFVRQLQEGRYTSEYVYAYPTEILYNESYCQARSYTIPELISEIPVLEVSVAEKEKEYVEKLDGGNTNALLSQISQMSLFNMPPVWNFYKDGYLSDTVFLSLAEKIQYYPAYITSIFVQNSPLPSHIFNKVMDKDFSILLKLVLQLCQIGESPREYAENKIACLKQNILENETLLEYEGHNIDSIASDLESVVKYFEQKGTTDAKERLFRLYISTYNYQMAGKMLTELQSINSTKYGRYADIGWLYLHTISDTVDWKPDLQKNEMLLLSAIADSSYLYSGMAETLYEYAFDTILPKYTPDFEDILTPKNLIAEQESLEINSDLFEIYPNPTSDYVNVRLNTDVYTEDVKEYFSNYGTKYGTECLRLSINLYDINSRLLESKNYYIDEEIKLNLKNYISGTYLIEIRNCFDKIVLRKIVKI